MYWGVDSVMRATDLVHGVKLYDHLVNWVSRLTRSSMEPAFWGRYLTRPGNRPALTLDEARYLLDRRCRILLVAAGVRALRGRSGYANGRQAAMEIGNIAWNLGVPPGVRIYADLEDDAWDQEWFLGWWSATRESRYAGMGLYGGAVRPHSWGRNVVDAAAGILTLEHPELVMSEPRPDPRMSIEPPGPPESAMPLTDPVAYIWSSRPCLSLGVDPRTAADLRPGFRPQGPVAYNIETVVWQYREGCPLGTHGAANVDLDLAKPEAFRAMWPPG